MKAFLKNVFKVGAIVGFVVVVYGMLMQILDIKTAWISEWLGYISILILPLGIFLGVYQLVKENSFSFLKAVSTGILVALIAAVIVMLYRYGRDLVADNVGNISALEDHERFKMEKAGASEVEIQERIDEIRSEYSGGLKTYFMTLKWYLFLGSGYTLLSYFILLIKTKRDEKNKT